MYKINYLFIQQICIEPYYVPAATVLAPTSAMVNIAWGVLIFMELIL